MREPRCANCQAKWCANCEKMDNFVPKNPREPSEKTFQWKYPPKPGKSILTETVREPSEGEKVIIDKVCGFCPNYTFCETQINSHCEISDGVLNNIRSCSSAAVREFAKQFIVMVPEPMLNTGNMDKKQIFIAGQMNVLLRIEQALSRLEEK